MELYSVTSFPFDLKLLAEGADSPDDVAVIIWTWMEKKLLLSTSSAVPFSLEAESIAEKLIHES